MKPFISYHSLKWARSRPYPEWRIGKRRRVSEMELRDGICINHHAWLAGDDLRRTHAIWTERGLKIVVVTQQHGFNGAVGRTLAALLMGLSEIAWEYRKERQQAGIAVAKSVVY